MPQAEEILGRPVLGELSRVIALDLAEDFLSLWHPSPLHHRRSRDECHRLRKSSARSSAITRESSPSTGRPLAGSIGTLLSRRSCGSCSSYAAWRRRQSHIPSSTLVVDTVP